MKREKIKTYVSCIINEKAQGNNFQELNIIMKLMFKGIPVKNILEDDDFPIDNSLEEKIIQAANELNVKLPNLVV